MFTTEKNDLTAISVHIVDSDGVYEERCCSLNGVAVGRLYYWCNCLGEISRPGANQLELGVEDDLPSAVADLYNKYQNEGNGFHVYTVTFNGRHGMLATLLVDQSWAEDWGFSMQSAFDGMKQVALQLQQQSKLPRGCEILVMQNTDPDGHELAFFFPAESCADFPGFAGQIKVVDELYEMVKSAAQDAEAITKNEYLDQASCQVTLPSGLVIRATADGQSDYPSITISLLSADGGSEQLCFVEHNPDKEPGKELCIGAYCSSEEDTVYYGSYFKDGGAPQSDQETDRSAHDSYAGPCCTQEEN